MSDGADANSSVEEPRPLFPDGDHETKPFVLTDTVFEDHGKAIYSCAFNPFLGPESAPQLAVCGINQVVIYEFPLDDPHIKVLSCFRDSTVRIEEGDRKSTKQSERYFVCNWLLDPRTNRTMIVAGGETGILRIIDAYRGEHVRAHYGHGNSVNDIRTHPQNSLVYCSASKDTTIRMWTVRTARPIATFAGFKGHKDQVLTCDISWCGNYILSGSMDHTVRMWAVTDKIKERIALTSSDEFYYEKSEKMAKRNSTLFGEVDHVVDISLEQCFTCCETGDVHTCYVDCVRVFYDFIISKSSECLIQVWKFGDFSDGIAGRASLIQDPRNNFIETSVSHFKSLNLENGSTWFVKLDIDPLDRWIVSGTLSGVVSFFSIDMDGIPSEQPVYQLTPTNQVIRQVCFERHGRVLACVADDGSVSRMDRVAKGAVPPKERKKTVMRKVAPTKQVFRDTRSHAPSDEKDLSKPKEDLCHRKEYNEDADSDDEYIDDGANYCFGAKVLAERT